MLFNYYLLYDEIDSILIFLKCLRQPVATFERIWTRNCQQAKTIPVQCLFRMLPSKHDRLPRNWLKCHLPKSRVSRVSCFTKTCFKFTNIQLFEPTFAACEVLMLLPNKLSQKLRERVVETLRKDMSIGVSASFSTISDTKAVYEIKSRDLLHILRSLQNIASWDCFFLAHVQRSNTNCRPPVCYPPILG